MVVSEEERSAATGIWWRPDRLAWWTGVLFAIGSLLFLIPAVAALSSSADWIGVTFFAGSIFFTTAALLQLAASSEVPHRRRPHEERRLLRPRAWLPHTVDWVAASIQFGGTLLFNINTFNAMDRALSTQQVNVRVWAPDMIGSGCFLAASLLAFANVEHAWLSFRPRDLDWWIAFVNLLGSLAFGAAAVASYVRPSTGSALDDAIANGGTAAGAAMFLIGAVLLLPQADRAQRRLPAAPIDALMPSPTPT